MRKRIIGSTVIPEKATGSNGGWLPLEQIATVEVTSEDPRFPVESVFASNTGTGWRALRTVSSNFGLSSMNLRHCIVSS